MEFGCLGFFLFVCTVVAVVMAVVAGRRATTAREEIAALRSTIDMLGRRVTELRVEMEKGRGTAAAATEAPPPPKQPEPPPQPVPPQTVPEPLPQTIPEPLPTPAPTPTPPPQQPPTPIAQPRPSAPPPPPPPPPPTPPPPTAYRKPPTPPKPPFDWESLVGVKLFSWIAGVALVLAAVFFLRYSVEHGWLSPTVRATMGLLTGTALLVVCELRVARDYKFTANALHGAGIAILYATLFATHALWHLLPSGVVFGLMLIVTAVAVLLSIRRDSIFIALLGLLGGFATPALLSTGENRPIGLFSYLLLLNVGLAWVAYRKRWPLLTACSVVLSVIYQWAWVAKFLTPSQLPLAMGIFVAFAVMAVTALWIGRGADERQSLFDRISIAGAALPLLFAAYSAAVPAYGARYNFLFGFLFLLAAGLALIARLRGPQWLHAVGGASVVLVFLLWHASSNRIAWPGGLWWAAAFVALYLVAGIWIRTPAVYAAAALFFVVPLHAYSQESPGLLFTVVFAMLAGVAAYALVYETGGIYYVASFFVVAAEAVWSSRHLTEERLIAGLTLYGVFALFFLGVPILARRFQRALPPKNGAAVLLLLSLALLFFLAGGAVANAALWGLALLLAVVNGGALFEARTGSNPILSAIAIVLSWIVIGVWWATATVVTHLIPAMLVIAGFGILVVAGNLWAQRGTPGTDQFGQGTYLGLAGHLFLAFVASQPSLSIPPWPMLGVLLVLDLAVGVAALWLRRASLLTAAMAGSQVVLMIWAGQAKVLPWPNVAMIAALLAGIFAVIWFRLDRRFALSAAAALFLGQVVAIIAGMASTTPLFASLLRTHLLFLGLLLAVAWMREWHEMAVLAVVTTALGTMLARVDDTPGRELFFAGMIYVFFIAYPLLLGKRVRKSLYPHLAAVLAGVPFFFFARDAIRDAGYDYLIGILPVTQAVIMLALLWQLLRIEGAKERLLSRLALVAAAALAFITVAIPLQLEKQWITIGWGLEGAALVWLFTRIPHRGLLAWAAGLLAAVFVRLVFNPAVFGYHPASHTPIVNWYLYTYLLCAVAFFVAAYFAPPGFKLARPLAASGGVILLFFLLNIEIADFYSTGPTLTFNFFSSSLAQDLTYTIGWAIFAAAMLVGGLALRTRAARIAAIALLLVTILKCALHDLWRLGGLYRIASLFGLAVSLFFVTILLQKYVLAKQPVPPPPLPEESTP